MLNSEVTPKCPVGGRPMGASYAAAELIKRNHRSKLKKHLFPDDKDGEEESLKVTPDTSVKVTPDDTAKVTPEKEKKKRKSSKPNKIDINKKSDESEDDSLEKPQLPWSNRLSPKKLEEENNLPYELQSIDWSSVVPETAGSYTVIVGGKPVRILVQTDDDTPVHTFSPKHHIELDNQKTLDGVDDKSLLSNSDLKTDDTRGEDVTDISRKQIDLNNPSTSMEVSVSDTELESSADKESAGEKPEGQCWFGETK